MTSEVKGVLSVTESKEAGFVACSDLAASQHGDLHQALMKTRQDKTRQVKSRNLFKKSQMGAHKTTMKEQLTNFTDSLFDDRLYSAILRSLEQTHCARMWF